MAFDFNTLVANAKRLYNIASNPDQASVAAGALSGAFSAEVQNYAKQARVDLEKFGQSSQILQTLGISNLFKKVGAGITQAVAPEETPRPGGLSYGTWAIVGVMGLILVLLVRRR